MTTLPKEIVITLLPEEMIILLLHETAEMTTLPLEKTGEAIPGAMIILLVERTEEMITLLLAEMIEEMIIPLLVSLEIPLPVTETNLLSTFPLLAIVETITHLLQGRKHPQQHKKQNLTHLVQYNNSKKLHLMLQKLYNPQETWMRTTTQHLVLPQEASQ